MRDYCWSLAGTELRCDPKKRERDKRNVKKLYLNTNTLNFSPGDAESFSEVIIKVLHSNLMLPSSGLIKPSF